MKIKPFLIILFGVFCCDLLCAQAGVKKDTIFIDEQDHIIGKEIGMRKCLSEAYHYEKFVLDSSVIYRIKYNYIFGKLDSAELKKVSEILHNNFNRTLVSGLIISYTTTINDYVGYIKMLDSLSIFNRHISEEFYNNSLGQYIEYQKKCIDRLRELSEYQFLYMYDENTGLNVNQKAFIWLRDYTGFFKNTFFKNSQKGTMLLRPDGRYFLRYDGFNDNDLFSMISDDDKWDFYYSKWEMEIKDPSVSKYLIDRLIINFLDKRYSERRIFKNTCF